jgi:hypothetical protein
MGWDQNDDRPSGGYKLYLTERVLKESSSGRPFIAYSFMCWWFGVILANTSNIFKNEKN